MSDECPFSVGDAVQFRSEHHFYRDHNRVPNEFTVVRVMPKDSDGWLIRYGKEYGQSVYHYRLQSAANPW